MILKTKKASSSGLHKPYLTKDDVQKGWGKVYYRTSRQINVCWHVSARHHSFRIKQPNNAPNIQNLFCHKTLHVSGIFCAHHQELSAVSMAIGTFQTDSARKRSHNLHETYQLPCLQRITPDDGQRRCPNHVEFYNKINFGYLRHLVGCFIRNVSRCTVTFHFIVLVHVCLWWRWITTQNIFAINQYTDYKNKKCSCPLLALLLFIDSVHLHLLPKPNFTILQLATSRCTKKETHSLFHILYVRIPTRSSVVGCSQFMYFLY